MVVFISIIILLTIGVLVMMARENKDNALFREEARRLYQVYEVALNGKERKAALQAGRAYYSMARKGGSPTASDEQAMANDLNTMPQEVFVTALNVQEEQRLLISPNLSSH